MPGIFKTSWHSYSRSDLRDVLNSTREGGILSFETNSRCFRLSYQCQPWKLLNTLSSKTQPVLHPKKDKVLKEYFQTGQVTIQAWPAPPVRVWSSVFTFQRGLIILDSAQLWSSFEEGTRYYKRNVKDQLSLLE